MGMEEENILSIPTIAGQVSLRLALLHVSSKSI
jgi:hypothetical protein